MHSRLHRYLRKERNRMKDSGRINGSSINLNITNVLPILLIRWEGEKQGNEGFLLD